jgi:hypothetical protein
LDATREWAARTGSHAGDFCFVTERARPRECRLRPTGRLPGVINSSVWIISYSGDAFESFAAGKPSTCDEATAVDHPSNRRRNRKW